MILLIYSDRYIPLYILLREGRKQEDMERKEDKEEGMIYLFKDYLPMVLVTHTLEL
jgi:hypothetical protein